VGAALGDLIQIIDNQTYLGEDLMNVYYFRWFSAPSVDNTVYTALLNSFDEIVIDKVIQAQNEYVTHTTLSIRNLSNNLDYAEMTIAKDGLLDVDPANTLQSYVTLGFQLIRDSLATRNGYKRISGLIESQVEGNDFVGSLTYIGDIISAMQANLYVGVIQVAAPVIVKRPIDPPVGTSYVYSSVQSVLFKGLGTQNSRKP
jgi:hypothetical protein